MADLDTRTISQPGAAYQFRRARYEVVSGPDHGLQGVTEQAELTIGTDRSCDIVLTDPTVSRHHLALTSGPDGLRLRDLGSKNGTRVGRMLVESATLLGAAIVEIGATAIRFDAHRDDGSEPMADSDSWGRVLGQSAAMRRIFAVLERVAPSDATVLLEGETGTGKTLVADAIHQASPRAGKPFMVVDCGALAPSLIESELFGHERGAFTGAHEPRAGAFEAAGGGTVFLDEVGELPLDMQPKLLRALDDRTVKRIGSNAPVRIDVRVIAATNRDLRVEVNRGAFRPDLFYRLNTVRIRIPPLRERPEDLAVLVGHFHRQFRGGEPAPELVAAMSRLSWPGNVRELRSAIERAVLLDDPAMWPEADREPAGLAFDASLPFRAAKERVVATWERRYLADLLAETGGNLSRAARLARMDRNHLRELTRRYKLTAGED